MKNVQEVNGSLWGSVESKFASSLRVEHAVVGFYEDVIFLPKIVGLL